MMYLSYTQVKRRMYRLQSRLDLKSKNVYLVTRRLMLYIGNN